MVLWAAFPWVEGASQVEEPCAGWHQEELVEVAPCLEERGEAWASGAWLQQRIVHQKHVSLS